MAGVRFGFAGACGSLLLQGICREITRREACAACGRDSGRSCGIVRPGQFCLALARGDHRRAGFPFMIPEAGTKKPAAVSRPGAIPQFQFPRYANCESKSRIFLQNAGPAAVNHRDSDGPLIEAENLCK
jgi:hypothetical protein